MCTLHSSMGSVESAVIPDLATMHTHPNKCCPSGKVPTANLVTTLRHCQYYGAMYLGL